MTHHIPISNAGVLALLALLLLPSRVPAQQPFPTDSSLRATLAALVGAGRAAGVVVGLLAADGTQRIVAYGNPGLGGLPLDGQSVFEIGSITKTFTGTLLADMVRRGEVGVEDPIATLLPADVSVPTRNGKAITLLDVTTHSSGLPRMPTNFAPADPANPYADYTVRQLYDFVSHYTLPRDPGAEPEYSNLAMGLLGQALARRAGASYETLVTDRLLRPLGMEHTGITLTPWMRDHLAHGHDALGDSTANWDIPTLAGAGALRSTTTDMLRYAAANLATADTGPLGAMHEAVRARRAFGAQGDSIGFNWIVSRRGERAITWHNGGTGGYRTFLGLDRAAGRAVVVLTNSGGAGLDDLGFHLLDPTVPLARAPVGPAVATAYRHGGVEAAVARYRTLRATEPEGWQFGEGELNGVGYWLLRQGQLDDAIQVFQVNVEMFPNAFNPYDSLGEAYLARGDTVRAITNYQRSVELNPGHTGGIEVLRQLGVRK
jgi:CubicO group peptidase (beta-lactamase class C family)